MGCHSGTRVKNATQLKSAAPIAGNRTVMVHPSGTQNSSNRFLVFCDITSDASIGWHLVFTAFPRIRTPYITSAYDTSNRTPAGSVPSTSDTDMKKISDTDIISLLSSGIKQTRTQWFHTSLNSNTVWADGSLTNDSTMYNEFDNPSAWSSNGASSGATFRRRMHSESAFTATITSTSGGCSGAVGGWSNYYEQSCIRSWFAGCEGGPALNHACANPADPANKLIIWAA